MFTYRDTGNWKQIICWLKGFHLWHPNGSEVHYDSSVSYYFVCDRCKKEGVV